MSDRARLYLLLSLQTLVNIGYMGARVDVPLLALDRGASTPVVGLLMGLFSLLPALLSVQAGRWVDRVGVATPLLATSGGMAVALVLGALFPSMWAMMLLSAIVGLTCISFNLAVTAAVGGIGSPEDRTANFALLALAGGIASFLGPLIAGRLIDAIGHVPTFAVLAVAPAIVAAVIVVMRLARTPRAREVTPAERGGKLIEVLRDRRIFGAMMIGSMISMGWDVFAFLVPVYGTRIGLSATAIGNILGAFGLAVFIIRLLLPSISRHLSEWRVVIATMFGSAGVFLLFPFSSAVPVLTALSFAYGLAFGASQPIITSLLFTYSPRGRTGEVIGLRSSLHNGVHTAMPALFGLLGGALGMLPAFWTVGAILAAGGWLSQTRWSKS